MGSLLLTTALWVGALATFAVVPGTSRRAALSTAGSGALLKRALLPGLGIVSAQAFLLAIAGWVALRLTFEEGLLLTAVSCCWRRGVRRRQPRAGGPVRATGGASPPWRWPWSPP